MSSPASRPAKRPKLASQSALTAPFKSPLRRVSSNKSISKSTLGASNKVPTTPAVAQSETCHSKPPDESAQQPVCEGNATPLRPEKTGNTRPISQSLQNDLTPKKPVVTPIRTRSTRPNFATPSDPQLAALKKQHTHELNALSKSRQQIETATQAVKILSSPRDEELQRLIGVWKAASRAAAEELFSLAKDRVNGMGGVGGWKDRERSKRERWGGDGGFGGFEGGEGGEEGGADGEGGEMTEAEREIALAERGLDELTSEERKKEVWEEEGDDDQGFTMDMMLRSMNVELDLIGYDKDMQRWVD